MKTLVVSDVHLGHSSFVGEVTAKIGARLIGHCRATTVILLGDIFDEPSIRIRNTEKTFLDALEKFMKKGGRVICIGGNHDRRPNLQHLMEGMGAEYHLRKFVMEVNEERMYFAHGDEGYNTLNQWRMIPTLINIIYLSLQKHRPHWIKSA